MLSRISNVASRQTIEDVLNAKFLYGSVYLPTEVISGLKESSVSIITQDRPHHIQFGIWGILPTGYENSWKDFQSVKNTLSVNLDAVERQAWLWDAFTNRRCLIISTGFFSSQLKKSKLYPFKIQLKTNELFCFAGIYNVLADGFISCTILSYSQRSQLKIIEEPNPLILKREYYDSYLTGLLSLQELVADNFIIQDSEFIAISVSRKIYKL